MADPLAKTRGRQVAVAELQQLEKDSAPADEIASQEEFANSVQPMHLFEIGKIGLPCAVVGSAFLILLGVRFLPNRKELIRQLGDQRREYMVEMMVPCLSSAVP